MSEALPEYIEVSTGASDPVASIIWLHGLGADGHDFEPIVPGLGISEHQPVRFIFPHAPQRPITINGGMVMRAWYDIKGVDLSQRVDMDGIQESADLVEALIADEIERGISSDKIFLAGFSQGGAVVLYAGLRHTQPLAGIIALSTYMPLTESNESEFKADKSLPIFMAHGDFDPVVSITLGKQSYQALLTHGFKVEWHTYPMQHSVSAEEVSHIGSWIKRHL